MVRRFACAVVFVCLFVVGKAPAVEFEHVASLGDSLLDDILGLRSPLVSEQLADRLDAPLTQFAHAGSTSASLIRQGQHTQAASEFGAGDLATLWIGGNDFFLSAANPFGVGIGNYRFMDRLEDNVDTILGTLENTGLDVLVFNLPDMSAVPFTDTITLFNFQMRNISEATVEWNDRLAELADKHGAHLVDVYSYFDAVSAHPENYTIMGHELVFGPEWGCQWCVFADPIHPTAVAQGLIANLAIDVLNEEVGGTPLARLTEQELAMLAGIDTGHGIGGLINAWRSGYGLNNQGDLDGDGDTDGRDLLLLQRGQRSGAAVLATTTVVPEPSSLALLSALSLLLCRPRQTG